MRAIKSRGTGPERALGAALRRARVRYATHVSAFPGTPDFLVPMEAGALAVFLHGCFWHRHGCRNGGGAPRTNGAFWRRKFHANVARDSAVRRKLRRLAVGTMVVWECEVRADADAAALRVKRRADRGGD